GRRVLLAGVGWPAELTEANAHEIGGAVAAHLAAELEPEAAALVDPLKGARLDDADLAVNFALGARLRAYRFAKYQTRLREDEPGPFNGLSLVLAKAGKAGKRMPRWSALAEGVCLARDLTNEPPNVLYPESFVEQAKALEDLGVAVEALDEGARRELGMNALLAVATGAARPPRLLVLRWSGAGKRVGARKASGPVALVGKGVCFDSGGLCLKPPKHQIDMKGDMAGGAAVVGAIAALARRKAKIDVVGVVALVENMPSGQAYRTGDIARTMSGRTIEVVDTDAEGRMVLVDALWYAATRFKPRCIVDLATLTYSVVAAVGKVFAGILANDDKLARQLAVAGETTGERLWRLPLDDAYDKHLGVDRRRLPTPRPGRRGRRCRAWRDVAQALRRWLPWAHLDIAGKEFTDKDTPLAPVGSTGYGVALVERFVAETEGIG
ncbi:MAG: leucyl aminopeptidase, partial [Dongiaceae bacterium]